MRSMAPEPEDPPLRRVVGVVGIATAAVAAWLLAVAIVVSALVLVGVAVIAGRARGR